MEKTLKMFHRHISNNFILSFLVLFLVFSAVSIVNAQQKATSNCVETKVGDPKNNSSAPPNCKGQTTPSPSQSGNPTSSTPRSCGDAPNVNYQSAQEYADAISKKWGITFNGLPLDQMQMVWQEFHKIDCVGILQDIKGSNIAGWSNPYSQQFSCPQDGGVNLYIGDLHGDFMRGHIAHEITHIWQFCTPRGEANLLRIPDVYNREGGLTNYSRTGCGFQVNLHNEDHAETISLYLNPDVGEMTCGNGAPNPFSGGGFPEHRSVAEDGTK